MQVHAGFHVKLVKGESRETDTRRPYGMRLVNLSIVQIMGRQPSTMATNPATGSAVSLVMPHDICSTPTMSQTYLDSRSD